MSNTKGKDMRVVSILDAGDMKLFEWAKERERLSGSDIIRRAIRTYVAAIGHPDFLVPEQPAFATHPAKPEQWDDGQ